MSWIPLHDSIFTDDWLDELNEAERWAYFCFVLHSRNQSPKWRIKKCKTETICRYLALQNVTFVTMLKAAIEAGKVTETETEWVVVNGRKYDYDPTNTARQIRYREKNKALKDGRNDNVTGVTASNATLPYQTLPDKTLQPSPLTPQATNLNGTEKAQRTRLQTGRTIQKLDSKLIASAIPKLIETKDQQTEDWEAKFAEIMDKPDDHQAAQLKINLKACTTKHVDLYPVFADLREFIEDGKSTNPNGLILNRLWKEASQRSP